MFLTTLGFIEIPQVISDIKYMRKHMAFTLCVRFTNLMKQVLMKSLQKLTSFYRNQEFIATFTRPHNLSVF
jgi:hypothetical protein